MNRYLDKMMKKLFSPAMLLVVLFGACQKDETIGPPELLYQRWQVDRTKPIGSDTWMMYNLDGIYDTEYRPDGALVHRKDGVIQTAKCCSASRFERNQNVIQYSEFVACALVLCNSTKISQITILQQNLLELQTEDRVTQYSPIK